MFVNLPLYVFEGIGLKFKLFIILQSLFRQYLRCTTSIFMTMNDSDEQFCKNSQET